MSNYGGGSNRGRGRGRSRGGGHHHNHHQRGGGGGGNTTHHHQIPEGPPPRLRPCRAFTTSGSCPNQNCSFAHVAQLHASIDATSTPRKANNSNNSNNNYNNSNYNQQNKKAPVTAVSIWETQGAIKIFTASQDGFWRLWNTSGGTFVKEFEHDMGGGELASLEVASNFLFVGFEAVSLSLPDVKAGMIHAWNLASPTNPPLEFHMSELAPYAHAMTVSQIKVVGTDHKVLSGSRDGIIRVWAFSGDRFALNHTLHGHVGEVTGLVMVNNTMLWSSSSTDRSIRLWNLSKNGGELAHVITSKTPGGGVQSNPQANTGGAGVGHTNAVTELLAFSSSAGTFVLSSSLDGTVKAWNGQNADCVASETHGCGIVSMALSTDTKGHPLLLVGLEWGSIMVRNVVQTPNAPAFCLLFTLNKKFTSGHDGPVKAIREGPSSTFYSGGDDGKLLVWQITGDLGL